MRALRPDQTDERRVAFPLFEANVTDIPEKARLLMVEQCSVQHARDLIRMWHSRLPLTQPGPWQYAFRLFYKGTSFGAALWNNPSARMLPGHWLELRRMAISPDAPHCAASRMLGEMAKFFRKNAPERERLISYQDKAVHSGTIYRAAGWVIAYESNPRIRDRSKPRPSGRDYRWNINGSDADGAGKIRWEVEL